jgi:hypothetical protein
MTAALIVVAALAPLGVVAGELVKLPFAWRKSAAGRSRMQSAPEKAMLLL